MNTDDVLDAFGLGALSANATHAGNAALQNVQQGLHNGYAASQQAFTNSPLYGHGLALGMGAGSPGSSHTFGSLGDLVQNDKAMRAGQTEAALGHMDPAAREKFEPVIRLTGITLKHAGSQAHITRANEWLMEIEIAGHWYRHVWDMEFNDTAEWNSELGHFLDKVSRIRKNLSGDDVADKTGSDDISHARL